MVGHRHDGPPPDQLGGGAGISADARRPDGYRLVAHTADVMIEAWASDRGKCVGEAVLALAEVFGDVGDHHAASTLEVTVDGEEASDSLMAVLEEVIFLADVEGTIPVDVDVDDRGDTLRCRFAMVPIDAAGLGGSAPKAVSWHKLSMVRDAGGWSCRVVIDV